MNVTEKELEAGHEYYSVTCLQLSRTVNPNIWNEENYDHELQEWFPEGYDHFLRHRVNEKINDKINNDKLPVSCSVEVRESMNYENEIFYQYVKYIKNEY